MMFIYGNKEESRESKQAIHTNKSQGFSLEGHQDTLGSNSEILLAKLLLWEKGKIITAFNICASLSTDTHTHMHTHTYIFIHLTHNLHYV